MIVISLCNNIYKQWHYQRDKKKLACLVLFPRAESSLKIRIIVFWHAPSRDNIIGFILHQLKISPLKCALPHGIESSKNFQTLPHNHIRPPTLNISDSDVILFVHKYLELVVMRMSPGKWGILLNIPFLHYTLMSAQQYDINNKHWLLLILLIFCLYLHMTLRKISEDSDQRICNGLWIYIQLICNELYSNCNEISGQYVRGKQSLLHSINLVKSIDFPSFSWEYGWRGSLLKEQPAKTYK